MAFKHIEHTADVTIQASGKTLEEAFSEACRAFSAVMTDDEVRGDVTRSLSLRAESRAALFFDFLGELVVLLDTEGLLPAGADLSIDQDDGFALSGTISGDVAGNYETHGDVKAPTYHALSVQQEDDSWVVTCTLDL